MNRCFRTNIKITQGDIKKKMLQKDMLRFAFPAQTTILHINVPHVLYFLIKLVDYAVIFSMLSNLHTVDQCLTVNAFAC